MNEAGESEASSRRGDDLIELQPRQLARVFLWGLVSGVVAWGLASFGDVVFGPLICGADPSCSPANTAAMVATILAAIIGLIGLIRVGIYRPIIVVVASAICLWDISVWVSGLSWAQSIVWSALLYGACYAAFAWLVRPRKLVLVWLLVGALILLARLLPMVL